MSDRVGRIMSKRKGPKQDDDPNTLADSDVNNFDDLDLRGDLEFSYTKENSGDDRGNEQQDEDRKSATSRIMRQRAMKKNSNPKPA